MYSGADWVGRLPFGRREIIEKGSIRTSTSPAWNNRLAAAIEGFPLPIWLTYALATALLAAVFVGIQVWQGAYRQAFPLASHLFIVLQMVYPLACAHYLDRVGRVALEQFQGRLVNSEPELALAPERLTLLPARQTLLSSLAGVLAFIILFVLPQAFTENARILALAPTLLSLLSFLAYMGIAWFGFGMLLYHTGHQLAVIRQLYDAKQQVDPFRPDPMYALSAVTSRTAILLLLNSYGWLAVGTSSRPMLGTTYTSLLLTNVVFISLGVFLFVWPLWGAHRLLVAAKSQALADNAEHFRIAIDEVHRIVAGRDLSDIDGWEKAISALQHERDHLDKLATWPWPAGTLRNFLLALIVPLLVWFMQFGLQRLLD
jgi:hypothetical protein